MYERAVGQVDLIGAKKLGLSFESFLGWKLPTDALPIRKVIDEDSGILISNEMDEQDVCYYEEKLVSIQKFEMGESNLDLTQHLNNFSHGRLFFVVGTKNGETKVEKLLW